MSTQLYLISPPAIDLPVFRMELEAALAASAVVKSFQLRLKEADDDTIKRAIKELMPVCRAHEVAFILNDRADICAELTCDGVHVGQEDLVNASAHASLRAHEAPLTAGEPADSQRAIKQIRQIVGEQSIIGVTCHASKHLAMEAGAAGADYVAFGAFYETTSKPKEKLEKWGTPTPEILEWWQTYMTLPCVAIGGINAGNCKPLVDAGADFIAVINAVWNHSQGAAAGVKEFSHALI